MLIDQGLNLMLYGMGTVFIFLTILVFATLLMSRLVQRLAPAPQEPDTASTDQANGTTHPAPHIVEAIRLALKKHRA